MLDLPYLKQICDNVENKEEDLNPGIGARVCELNSQNMGTLFLNQQLYADVMFTFGGECHIELCWSPGELLPLLDSQGSLLYQVFEIYMIRIWNQADFTLTMLLNKFIFLFLADKTVYGHKAILSARNETMAAMLDGRFLEKSTVSVTDFVISQSSR